MSVKHMKIFIAVYQQMSITKAAAVLHMTQPAVTRAIHEIEKYYGIILFERRSKRLYKTDCGEEFYAQAIQIANSFDRMEKGMRNWDEFGVLRVGATIALGNFLMPRVVEKMQNIYPGLSIKVQICNGMLLQESLMNNAIDLALIEGNITLKYLKAELLARDKLVLIMSPEEARKKEEKIYLEELAKSPLLLREKGSAGRTFLEHIFALHGLLLEPMWESVSTQALVKAVGRGLGISFLPYQLVQEDIEKGSIVTKKVEDEKFIRDNFITWHENKYLTESAKKFIQICHDFTDESVF